MTCPHGERAEACLPCLNAPQHCGYNTCAGNTVECECACGGCVGACKRFADAVLRKGTVTVTVTP